MDGVGVPTNLGVKIMAQLDFTDLTSSASTAVVRRGVTTGITPPNGGGSFVYGWNSVSAGIAGTHGAKLNILNFNPSTKGGRMSAALVKLTSGSTSGFSPYIFVGGQNDAVSDNAYMLGIQDGEAGSIVLRKGAVSGGLPQGNVGDSGILRKSTTTIPIGTWVHLRIDWIVNPGGDIILKVYQNDLTTNPVSAPVWVAIAGMDDFVDDALGINSGSLPYTSGRWGKGFTFSDANRRAAIDHLVVESQL